MDYTFFSIWIFLLYPISKNVDWIANKLCQISLKTWFYIFSPIKDYTFILNLNFLILLNNYCDIRKLLCLLALFYIRLSVKNQELPKLIQFHYPKRNFTSDILSEISLLLSKKIIFSNDSGGPWRSVKWQGVVTGGQEWRGWW